MCLGRLYAYMCVGCIGLTLTIDTGTTGVVAVENINPLNKTLIISLGVAVVVALGVGILIGYFVRRRVKGNDESQAQKKTQDADTGEEEGEEGEEEREEEGKEEGEEGEEGEEEGEEGEEEEGECIKRRPPALPPYPHPSIPQGEFSALKDIQRNVPCRESIESGYIDSSEINTKSRIEEANSVIVIDKNRIPTYLSLVGVNVSVSEPIHVEGLGNQMSNAQQDFCQKSDMSSEQQRIKSQFPEKRLKRDVLDNARKTSVIVEEDENEV